MTKPGAIRFFVDHCVPDSVGKMLVAEGYETVLLRQQIAPNSPDPLVAAVSEMNGAVLVSLDSDFKALAPRAGVGRRRFRTLSRIGLRCKPPIASARLKLALSLIEHEWQVAQASVDKRLIVEVGHSTIRTIR
jgi:hypothetical protein